MISKDDYSFEYGPFIIGDEHEKLPTVGQLKKDVHVLQKDGSNSNQIREWISLKMASASREWDVIDRLKAKASNDEKTILEKRPESLLKTTSLSSLFSAQK